VQVSKDKEVRNTLVNELHSTRGSHEAGILRRYIDYRLDELAQKALSCDVAELHDIQGRAKELRELSARLMEGVKRPPGQPTE